MDETLKRLGERIREIRVQRGFASQEALAEYLKVHRTFVGHLETGRKDFRLTTIIRVAEALGVSLADMFAGVEGGKPFKAKQGVRGDAAERVAAQKEIAVLERSLQRLKELV